MGNLQSSCFQFPMIISKPESTATLFDAKGNFLRRVNLPLKAAELMLEEEPGHVISPADDLRRTGRFSAMKADDELLPRKCYVLVPLSKLNRKASEADVAVLDSALKSKKSTSKRNKNKSKVSPTTLAEDSKEEEEEESEIRVLDISVGVTNLGFMCRQRGYRRGWKPNLDTITEVSSRF